eukprot:Seg1704.5_Seg1704.6 transcript_id=Seg1704.5_Seg1704.6/GoldUCD/mRNA.D3Y31 product="Decapping and exoribonuclease protein" protein_id=Seg1704.5_Seg1704.6/GoldUCD/D3Y31
MKRTSSLECDTTTKRTIREKDLSKRNDSFKQDFKRAKTSSHPIVFNVRPADDRFNKKFPYFRQPTEIGALSVDIKRVFHDSRDKLREYVPPSSTPIKFDLKRGFDTFVARDEDVPERLDHMLQWINLHRNVFRLPTEEESKVSKSINTDFVTWRGHLVKILCTPYEDREPWRMDMCKHNGTIYISEVETEMKREQRLNETQRQKEMCYWGYSFEGYMTRAISKNTKEEADKGSKTERKETNNCEAFCSVVRTRLNKNSLVFGAEVDCCTLRDGKVIAPDSYIELKTSRIIDNPRQMRNFANFKMKKFWAQSYIAGVPKIICGMRDDDGIVRELHDYKTLDLPKIAASHNARWEASVCMNFLDEFLEWNG